MHALIEQVNIGAPLLEMNHITKVYPNGFVANKDVNFSLRKGEIHGLIGENGAGKTTLMKVLFGLETPEEGEVRLGGERLQVSSPLEALDYGIGMVHQHFMLVDSLTVAENMALGHEPVKGVSFDLKKAIENVMSVSSLYGLAVDPKAKVRDLSVGYKQRVEILRMLLHGAKILLLDEPTAVLTPQETEELFVQLKNLKLKGYSIVFISHKLNEVKEICDRITILKNGRTITTVDIDTVTEQEISNLMVGREIDLHIEKSSAKPGDTLLSVDRLSYFDGETFALKGVSFSLRQGEILGVASVEGNGQAELSDILAGLKPVQFGDVRYLGKSIRKASVKEIRGLGVSIIHEDRMSVSASTNQSISDNIIADCYDQSQYVKKGLLDRQEISEKVDRDIVDFQIKCDSKDSEVRTLSGGNIQKVVAAREFTSNPKVLIACQPTRGIDVGAADLIRKKIISLRDELNTGVLLFSADLTELLSVSDSIMVLYDGQLVAYFEEASNIDERVLGEYMLGIKRQPEEEIREVLH